MRNEGSVLSGEGGRGLWETAATEGTWSFAGVSGELDTIRAAHEAREHNQQAKQHKESSFEELMKHCRACMQTEGRKNFSINLLLTKW